MLIINQSNNISNKQLVVQPDDELLGMDVLQGRVGNYISTKQQVTKNMSFITKLQNQYDQLWKYIIRPTRSPYPQQSLGPSIFTIKGKQFHRKDFLLTNKRGYDFACSLWLPIDTKQYPCVIYLHCNSSNRIQGTEYLRKLLVNKIALCTFDFSGCGNAEGEYISLGYYQQDDLEEVINFVQQYPNINNIALWGRSMGAVTTLLYLAKNGKAKGVKAAILDSPFKSLKALVQDMAQKMVKIPNLILSGALKIISGTIQQKAKFSIYQLDPLKKAVPFLYTPCFFIVGIKDQMVPVEHTKDLFQAYAGDDKCIRMVKGGHNDNRPKECVREVVRFLLKRFNRQQKVQVQQKSQQFSKEQAIQQSQPPQKVDDKKEQFRWGSFFSIFKKQQKQAKSFKKSEKQKQKPEIPVQKPIKPPQHKKDEQKRILTQSELQDQMRQLTNCYL